MTKAFLALLVIALAGCSVTEKETPTDMSGSTTGGSGFLSPGTYAKLQPGTKDQVGLVYIDPSANWQRYSKVYIAPVTIGLGSEHNVSEQDQQMLSSYYYHALEKDLTAKGFTLANQPAPDALTVRVALTDATTATPVLRTISVVIPQARLLNAVGDMATGSYAFVGSAQSEGEILGPNGQVLAAAIDKRSGGMSIKNADVWEWGDAENAMDFWAERLATRLQELHSGGTPTAALVGPLS